MSAPKETGGSEGPSRTPSHTRPDNHEPLLNTVYFNTEDHEPTVKWIASMLSRAEASHVQPLHMFDTESLAYWEVDPSVYSVVLGRALGVPYDACYDGQYTFPELPGDSHTFLIWLMETWGKTAAVLDDLPRDADIFKEEGAPGGYRYPKCIGPWDLEFFSTSPVSAKATTSTVRNNRDPPLLSGASPQVAPPPASTRSSQRKTTATKPAARDTVKITELDDDSTHDNTYRQSDNEGTADDDDDDDDDDDNDDNDDEDLEIIGQPGAKTSSVLTRKVSACAVPDEFFLPKNVINFEAIQEDLLEEIRRLPTPKGTDENKAIHVQGKADSETLRLQILGLVNFVSESVLGTASKGNFEQWRRWFVTLDLNALPKSSDDALTTTCTAVNSPSSHLSMQDEQAPAHRAIEEPLTRAWNDYASLSQVSHSTFSARWKRLEAEYNLWEAMQDLEEKATVVWAWSGGQKASPDGQDQHLLQINSMLKTYKKHTLGATLNQFWCHRFGYPTGEKKIKTIKTKVKALWTFTQAFGREFWIFLPREASSRSVHTPVLQMRQPTDQSTE